MTRRKIGSDTEVSVALPTKRDYGQIVKELRQYYNIYRIPKTRFDFSLDITPWSVNSMTGNPTESTHRMTDSIWYYKGPGEFKHLIRTQAEQINSCFRYGS